jgi:hypothetical protein
MVVSDSSDGSDSDTKLKNSNCEKTQKLKVWPITKILNATKFKNSNCDKTKKENCDKTQNSNCDKTQKLKLQQNLRTQIVTKLKNLNCDKTKKKTLLLTKLNKIKLWQN